MSVGALQSLSRARASPFQPIMEKLLMTADELQADPSYLSQVRLRSHSVRGSVFVVPDVFCLCHFRLSVVFMTTL